MKFLACLTAIRWVVGGRSAENVVHKTSSAIVRRWWTYQAMRDMSPKNIVISRRRRAFWCNRHNMTFKCVELERRYREFCRRSTSSEKCHKISLLAKRRSRRSSGRAVKKSGSGKVEENSLNCYVITVSGTSYICIGPRSLQEFVRLHATNCDFGQPTSYHILNFCSCQYMSLCTNNMLIVVYTYDCFFLTSSRNYAESKNHLMGSVR